MKKHYVTGAGMVGCLYDYGPNACETAEQALADFDFYTETPELEGAELTLFEADVAEFQAYVREHGCGIFYFSGEVRAQLGADYFEISEVDGPCPEGEE